MTVLSPPFAEQSGSYSAEIARRAWTSWLARGGGGQGSIAGGLMAATDLALSAPVSGMSVNVAAGECWVPGSTGAHQTGYHFVNDATVNLAVAASNVTNPRIDSVTATITDAAYTGATNTAVLQVNTGTPTPGATLVNLSGAPALPTSSLLLGYILVPANSTNVTAGNLSNKATTAQPSISVPVLGVADPLQNGVIASGDLLASSITLSNTSTGAITVSVAAGTAWVLSAAGVLTRIAPAVQSAQVIVPGSLPASTKYAVVGLEIDTAGALHIDAKGADTATQLNTGSLIAANTPAVTSGRLRIADFAIWNNSGTYNFGDHTTTGSVGVNWIDRRPWARGAHPTPIVRTANASAGSDYAITTTVADTVIDAINLALRVECTGVPLRVRLKTSGAFSTDGVFFFNADGANIVGAGAGFEVLTSAQVPAFEWEYTPAAGSHLFQPTAWLTTPGTTTLRARSTLPMQFTVEEIVRQNANNGTA